MVDIWVVDKIDGWRYRLWKWRVLEQVWYWQGSYLWIKSFDSGM